MIFALVFVLNGGYLCYSAGHNEKCNPTASIIGLLNWHFAFNFAFIFVLNGGYIHYSAGHHEKCTPIAFLKNKCMQNLTFLQPYKTLYSCKLII